MTSNFIGINIYLIVINANLNCDGAHQRKVFILNISPLGGVPFLTDNTTPPPPPLLHWRTSI